MIRVNSLSEGLSRLRQKFGKKSTRIWSGKPLSRDQVGTLLRKSESPFYVYLLIRPDTNNPFYIGKGTNTPPPYRVFQHEKNVETKHPEQNTLLHDIIKKLERENYTIKYEIEFFDVEQDALNREIELISRFGRIDLGSGCLANLTEGGEGISGISDETRQKMSNSRTEKWRQDPQYRKKHTARIRRGVNHPFAKPVFVYGKRFETKKKACDELGFSYGKIDTLIKNGVPGCYYEAEGQRPEKIKQRTVVVKGKPFSSEREASKDLTINMSRGAIQRAIHRGEEGFYKISEGQRSRRKNRRRRLANRACFVDGQPYESTTRAAKAHGVAASTIRYWIDHDLHGAKWES